MKKLVFVCAVSGVGKSTVCDHIRNSKKLDQYEVLDIDELEDVHEYNSSTYNLFYENAIKKAVEISGNKSILMASSINPTDVELINLPKEIEEIHMIALTCSNDELYRRLKSRDPKRNCGSDEFIYEHINYQNWILQHINLYQLCIDNTNSSVEEVASRIIDYIKTIDNVKKK